MEIIISEKVSVLAIYDKTTNLFSPKKFKWQQKEYDIKKIAFYHQVREGRDLFHVFSASTGTLDLLLKFNAQSLEWVLEKVSDGNAF